MLIAHLSDLHLSAEHGRRNLRRAKRLLDFVLRSGVNHLVVTGDITADARPSDLQVARNLFASCGLLDPARLTVIPGNHDIYGGVHTAEEILEFPSRCRSTMVEDREQEFLEAFRETFRGSLRPKKGHPFPFAKVVGEVVFFGLNSVAAYSPLKNPVGSNGKVGQRQRDHLKELLRTGIFGKRRRIVLIHHHFEMREPGVGRGALRSLWNAIEGHTMKLRGKKELLRLLDQERVDLILHGHVHLSHRYRVRGMNFLNAGGSVMGTGEGSVNFVRVRQGRLGVEIHPVPAGVLEPPGRREEFHPTVAGHAAA
jgi:3',5'-cyclic AMP phosphodiesterase CpdA